MLLYKLLRTALDVESRKHYTPYTPENARAYRCCVIKCSNMAYAKNLCNAHYLRKRKGDVLDSPLRCRKRTVLCVSCGVPTHSKSGWSRCKRCYKTLRRELIKTVLIEYLGSVCNCCKKSYAPCVFDFHHKGHKLKNVSKLVDCASLLRIATEATKCVLLCANCHRLETNGKL